MSIGSIIVFEQPEVSVMVSVTSNVPKVVNKCHGFGSDEVSCVPDAGSPKSQK